MNPTRPSFRKAKSTHAYESPEELFAKLPNRATTHGYLRTPQADALREYAKLVDERDIALELPTGTGKTAVGLLIAEWRRRRTGENVAFLALTNQLATQVLREAERLGVVCADLRGTKETRDPAEVGRYKTAQAVGVTTYSNLFNVNPVVQASDVLVLDDAHGGEHFASEMWTVRIDGRRHANLYGGVLAALRPSLTDSQHRAIAEEGAYRSIEIADARAHPEAIADLTTQLDREQDGAIHFPWSLIRNKLQACLFFASSREIVIRPLVPPTHTHAPFADSKQRIYMSATLGGEGDLLRGYGVPRIKTIRAKHAQWGRRYLFMPEVYLDTDTALSAIADVWRQIAPQRAVLLAPSFSVADEAFAELSTAMASKPVRLGPRDIEDSLEAFTKSTNSILCLAGRYDGLDLPGDDCRMLVIADTPAAVGSLERHLREYWKLGPLLRRRERTRLIQGMGRCTRDATDYAVIFLLGQSIIDSVTAPTLLRALPSEIQREIRWGLEQTATAREHPDQLVSMIVGLLTDPNYRKDANESVDELELPAEAADSFSAQESGRQEVEYSAALWDGNLSRAYEVARDAADKANAPELAGYRAWWLYLGSLAALSRGDGPAEIDCLSRARATGINGGYLDRLLQVRSHRAARDAAAIESIEAERIWNRIDQWGWQGVKFGKALDEMLSCLAATKEATKFHIGLELLGQALGAETTRPTADGAPDVVWLFQDRCFTFEAKAGSILSKKYVLQAKAHPDWVRAMRPELRDAKIQPLVVSPDAKLDEIAGPFAGGLNHVAPKALAEFALRVADALRSIRAQFAGKDFAASLGEMKVAVRTNGLDASSVDRLLSEALSQ
jgi:hypothetical protein